MFDCYHWPILPEGTCSFCNSTLPASLLDICSKYICNNPDTICVPHRRNKKLRLKRGIHFPTKISEKLFHLHKNNRFKHSSHFISIFKDKQSTKLKKVTIKDNFFTDKDLEFLLQHELTELSILYNTNLSIKSLDFLSKYGRKLNALTIHNNQKIFPVRAFGNYSQIKKYNEQGFIFQLPTLKRLTLKNINFLHPDFYLLILQNLPLLQHLDLSNSANISSFHFQHTTHLTSLVLYNVPQIDKMVSAICKLKNLKRLDISQSRIENGIFDNENQILSALINSLPKLTSLDISGTNLAGPGVLETIDESVHSDIPGLSSRISSPLQYLGLFETSHDACRRHDIPAKVIAGNANEEQLLVAGLAFLDHLELLVKVLKEFSRIIHSKSCIYFGHALNIVLESMDRFIYEKDLQILGSSLLLSIVKGAGTEFFRNISVKRRIFVAFLDALNVHRSNATLLRNMCTTACYFDIPDDVIFDFERLIETLLQPLDIKNFDKKKVLQFLNTLACHVDIPEKIKIGDLGVMEKMIWLIEYKLRKLDCDETLEFAWTIMWNATDETPSNSRKFVELGGMEHFSKCYEEFSNDEDLVSSMLGLLGNVSEVIELHHYLMMPKYLSVFNDLLDSKCDGIEVSYNASGIIAYIASNGPSYWTVKEPDRNFVLDRLDKTIDRWSLNSKRSMMYRCFNPVWYLIKCYHTPQCQKWGLWTLANLTKVYPDKYCVMIEQEGGLALLQELLDHSIPPPSLTNLAAVVIENCQRHKGQSEVVSN